MSTNAWYNNGLKRRHVKTDRTMSREKMITRERMKLWPSRKISLLSALLCWPGELKSLKNGWVIQEFLRSYSTPIVLGSDQVIKRFFNWFHQLMNYMQNTIYNQYRRGGEGGADSVRLHLITKTFALQIKSTLSTCEFSTARSLHAIARLSAKK